LLIPQSVDFLNDTSANRYAYESDDEDQLNPLTRHLVQRTARITIQGDAHPGISVETIIVASGEAGKAWYQGAQLGEQRAAVMVDDSTVGFIFLPFWSDVAVIVSEVSKTLPTWAMRPYAEAIVGTYNPKRLLLLDVYSAPSYISPEPLEVSHAPVRYLRTHGKTAPDSFLVPFLPPNLIQATSAAFASIAALPTSQMDAVLLLLPSRFTTLPRGNDISSAPHVSEEMNTSYWSETMMRQVHGCLVELSGVRAPADWQGDGLLLKQLETKRRGDIGDGGMYM